MDDSVSDYREAEESMQSDEEERLLDIFGDNEEDLELEIPITTDGKRVDYTKVPLPSLPTERELNLWEKIKLKLNNELLDKRTLTNEDKNFLADLRAYNRMAQMSVTHQSSSSSGLITTANTVPVCAETINLSHLVQTPVKFNGMRPQPRQWFEDYLNAIVANGWSKAIASKYFSTFLERTALDWYKTVVRKKLIKIQPENQLDIINREFTAQYLGQADDDRLQSLIDNLRQRPGEPISLFLPKLQRLMISLNEKVTEIEIIRTAKNKLRPEYKAWIVSKRPTTVDELRNVGLDVEAGLPNRYRYDDTGEERTIRYPTPSPKRPQYNRYNSRPQRQPQQYSRQQNPTYGLQTRPFQAPNRRQFTPRTQLLLRNGHEI